VAGDRLSRIMAALGNGDVGRSSTRLCQVSSDIVGVCGAGVMLMGDQAARGSLCTTNGVSALIEDLQFTLGEGPCLDAYGDNRVVAEPDLADPAAARWVAFTPRAVAAGVGAVFAFPVRSGPLRLGALDLYQDHAGSLSDDQHADALVMADVVARWLLDVQADAAPGTLATELELGSEFYFIVHNAAGALSVQLGSNISEAMVRMRAYAFSNDLSLRDVAQAVVARTLLLERGN